MKTINYQGQSIEVTEDFYNKYQEIERKDFNIEHKETRRHMSLSKALDSGFDIEDTRVTAEQKQIKQDEFDELYAAINNLLPEQRDLINKIYFQNMTVGQIAKEDGVSSSAISHRLERVLTRLRIFLIDKKM